MDDLDNKRKRFLLLDVEDLIVDYVEACIFDKDWTAEEGVWVYNTIGRRGVRGLLNKWLGPLKKETKLMEQVILYKGGKDEDHPEGCTIPKEVLVEAIKEHNQAISLAAFSDEKLVVVREITEIDADSTFDNLAGFTDAQAVLCFHSKEETVQPWIVLGTEESPELIAFLHGEDAVIADVIAKIKKWHASEDTFDELWERITNPNSTALNDLMKENSALLLFASNGMVHEILNGKVSTETSWGTCYGEPSDDGGGSEIRAADEHKRPSSPVTFGKKAAVESQQVAATREKVIKPPKVPMAQLKPEDISAFSTKYKGRCNANGKVLWMDPDYEPFIRCPETAPSGGHMTRDLIQKWHEEWFGWIPLNWSDRPIIPKSLSIQKRDISLDALKGGTSLSSPPAAKDTVTKNVPPGMNLPPAMINDFKAMLPKIFGNNAEEIANPESLKKQQTGIKSIAELIGRESIYDFRMGWLARLHIAKEVPEVAARIWGDMQSLLIEYHDRIEDLETNVRKQDEEITNLNSAIVAGTKEVKKASTFGKKS